MRRLILLGLLAAAAAFAQCSGTPDPRNWIGTYAGGTTYALCDVVYYSNSSYVSIQAANTGHQPDISSTWWTVIYSAPVNFQSGDQLKGSYVGLNYNLAWLRANGSGGANLPHVTNLISGDGTGNGADSGIAAGSVALTSGSYSNPAWITALAYAKITGVPTFAATKTPVSHQWLASYDSSTGLWTQTQPVH